MEKILIQVKMSRKFLALLIFILLVPFAYSNGGCIKIVDDVIILMSEAPLISKVNKQSSYLFSFVHNDSLINESINGTLKIMKGDEIMLTKTFEIRDGVLDLKHTFQKSGNYEIYLDFNYGKKFYNPEDFNIEVIENQRHINIYSFIFLLAGLIIGFALAVIHIKYVQN